MYRLADGSIKPSASSYDISSGWLVPRPYTIADFLSLHQAIKQGDAPAALKLLGKQGGAPAARITGVVNENGDRKDSQDEDPSTRV
jgi:hypothetical protein